MARTTLKTFLLLSELLRNVATECLPRICLLGNLLTNPLPSNGCTFNNIKVDLREIGCGGMDWIRLAQDRE
jgi:hypothetical protein